MFVHELRNSLRAIFKTKKNKQKKKREEEEKQTIRTV